MQCRALSNPKIEVLWNSKVTEAYEERSLGGLKENNMMSGEVTDFNVYEFFFAIGHELATKFLDGQLEVDSDGYVIMRSALAWLGDRNECAVNDEIQVKLPTTMRKSVSSWCL
ncbi:unnamed protein product [Fraxinus pennsylvanica]|uniref:Uncharacterized protein n=1 Tax=Fraxinus pennsylvanica TaxID=56036 RepID=A0AAD2AIG6_9LAMI|nr:unnamed protein product [Fraxinus pennsylvanica]